MNFKRFQISNVQVPDDVLFLYGSRTIRSKIIQNLLQKFNIDKGQIYTRTDSDKNYYKGWLSKSYVSPGINKEGVAYLLKKQTQRKHPAFIIFDNCFDDQDSMDFICQVCKKAKKYGVLVIISCNRGEDIPPEVGSLATCAMLSENNNKSDRQELFAAFGKVFKTDRVFYKCFDYLTEDDNLMVVCDNNSDDLQSQVYWYPIEGSPDATSSSDITATEASSAVVLEESSTQNEKTKTEPPKPNQISSSQNTEIDEEKIKNMNEEEQQTNDDKYEERDTCSIM
jgi:hypothetical protein